MVERGWARWHEIRDSLWLLPAILTAVAVGLAFATVWVDQTLLLDRRTDVGWLFGGGAEGARGVLSAIAGTMITVTALVFSITVVALQLAASQLTPRVLRSFMGNRPNQIVLGFFIATFTFALLVLRAVRSPLEGDGGFVPALSVSIAIVFALVSVGLLIFYVHHAANSMRTSVVIDGAAAAALDLVARLYPDEIGHGVRPRPPARLTVTPAATVTAEQGGYVQTINETAIFALAEQHSLTVRVEPKIGDFVLPGSVLASIWPEAGRDDEVAEAVRLAVILGPERTRQHDLELNVQLLVDIAVRALSPGINDPTTATICIDRLSEVIVMLANRTPPDEVRAGDDGSVRLVLRGPSFAHLVEVAFAQIRHYGTGDPAVAAHLIGSLGQVAALAPPARHGPLLRQADESLRSARDQLPLPGDRRRLDAAAAWMAPAGSDPLARAAEPAAAPERRGRDDVDTA